MHSFLEYNECFILKKYETLHLRGFMKYFLHCCKKKSNRYLVCMLITYHFYIFKWYLNVLMYKVFESKSFSHDFLDVRKYTHLIVMKSPYFVAKKILILKNKRFFHLTLLKSFSQRRVVICV